MLLIFAMFHRWKKSGYEMCFMWEFKDKSWSKIAPRFFTVVLEASVMPPREAVSPDYMFVRCLGPYRSSWFYVLKTGLNFSQLISVIWLYGWVQLCIVCTTMKTHILKIFPKGRISSEYYWSKHITLWNHWTSFGRYDDSLLSCANWELSDK